MRLIFPTLFLAAILTQPLHAARPEITQETIAASTPSQWQNETGYSQNPLDDTAWWKKFNDPILDSLIASGLERNFNLAMATRRIEIARQKLRSIKSAYYPTVGMTAGWSKMRNSGNTTREHLPATSGDYFSAGLNASWEIDLFGKITARVRQSKSQLKATRAETAGVMVSLCAEIADAYINLRMYQDELTVAREHLSSQNHVFKAVVARHEAGLASKLDVAQAAAIVHSTEAMIPQLESGVASAINSLALLTGRFPDEMNALNDTLSSHPLEIRQIVSCGAPLDLLRRRPDIAEAEFNLSAAASAIGIAKKEYLPSLSITGSIGFDAHNLKDIGKKESLAWNVAPTLSWTVFDGMARRATVVSAREQFQVSVDAYNLALLTAVEEVSDAMTAYSTTIAAIDSYRKVVEDSREAFTLSFDLYRDGLSSFTNVADAQISLLQYADRLVTSRADAATALVSLYRALGGGWDVSSIER